MQLEKYDFNNLPFSELFKTYTQNFDRLRDFYEINPFNASAIKKRAASFSFGGNREKTAALLQAFNKQFGPADAALSNIERLKQDDALTIVTGQQLGLYSGPVFTMFKTISTIQMARKWENELNRPVIPIFWLADEDHDYDEIRSIRVLNDEVKTFSLPEKEPDPAAVAELEIPQEIEKLQSSLKSTLIDTDFSDDLWQLLNSCFKPGATFLEAFGKFMTALFSKHGLVLAGSNQPDIKQYAKKSLIEAVNRADDLREALENQSQKLETDFHQQATIYDSHIFYLHPENGRLKIQCNGEGWETETGQEWSSRELAQQVQDEPKLFSPDVFLRPVLQDTLLPTLGYVAGPGEVAYYGQMKSFYHCFDMQMPAIFPRFSATFIEPAIDRILHELPFKLYEYDSRIEDLESQFVDRSGQTDIEAIFEDWKTKSDSLFEPKIDEIASIDETLEGAAKKARAAFFNELDKLKGKTYRAVKKREEIQLNRIRRIQENIFPDHTLQERSLCGIYYMNKFGLDIWDRLLEKMDDDISLDSHKLIHL